MFKKIFFIIILVGFTQTLLAQVQVIFLLDTSTVYLSPLTNVQNGIYPSTNHENSPKDLIAEPLASNANFFSDIDEVHLGGPSNEDNIFFGGDTPTSAFTGGAFTPIITKKTYNQSDFPIFLEGTFYNHNQSTIFNESYFWIGDAAYELYGLDDLAKASSNGSRCQEGIIIGGIPKRALAFDNNTRLNPSRTLFDITHAHNDFGQWFNMKACIVLRNDQLIIERFYINDNLVTLNTINTGPKVWSDNFRVGIGVDDLATTFSITTNVNTCELECNLNFTEITIDGNNPTSCTEPNGSIIISAKGLVEGESYEIFFQNNSDQSKVAQGIAINEMLIIDSLDIGTYNDFIIRHENCETVLDQEVTLVIPSIPNTPQAVILEKSCLNKPLILSTIGSSLPVIWEGPNNFSSNNDTIIVAESATTVMEGLYYVKAVEGDCESKKDSILINLDIPDLDLGEDVVACEGNKIDITATNNFKTYAWSDGSDQSMIQVSTSGTYSLTVTNNANCKNTDSIYVDIIKFPEITPIETIELDFGDSIVVNPEITPSENWTYNWSPQQDFSCNDCLNPTIKTTVNQLYTLTVSNQGQCEQTIDFEVNVSARPTLYIPNTFSPNNDGINDYFSLLSRQNAVRNIHYFEIYDRWGNLVFSVKNIKPSTDSYQGWDGTFNGEKMNPATFAFKCKVEFLDGHTKLINGDITLVR